MSIRRDTRFECLCGVDLVVEAFESLNALRHPQYRDAVMARRLHAYECPRCGRAFRFDEAFIYSDFERRQLLGAFPEGDRERARACSEALMEAYRVGVLEGPEGLAAQSDDFLVRACFGHEELREKLVIDEAGLDDLVIEVLKGDLLRAEPWFEASRVVTLTLDHVGEQGELVFWPVWMTDAPRGEGPVPPQVVVARSVYDETALPTDELLARRPGIASGPHVSLLRLIDVDRTEARSRADA